LIGKAPSLGASFFVPKVAILVDGGFFLKRYPWCYGKRRPAAKVSKDMHEMALKHIDKKRNETLYRILFYDCAPLLKKVHLPVSLKSIDFAKTTKATFRLEFHECLKNLRKVALRLGHLSDGDGWILRPRITKDLLNGKRSIEELSDNDLTYSMRQKGVDIKIGIDITSLALKRMVEKIVLVSGDADFIPAAKLARREGIDFVLDPMWGQIQPGLNEHIDGLTSKCPKSK